MTSTSEPHPVTGQPVGAPVDATPAQRPSPVTLAGRYGRIERLAQHHDAALWSAVKGHDHIWTYMSYGPLASRSAFETLAYRRYDWKCNALNGASCAAAQRYGFVYEGTFRQHMITKSRSRDTAYYSMLDSEWPARQAAFERWLAPENFDAQGRQRVSLSELSAAR